MLENVSPIMIALFQVDFTLSALIKPELFGCVLRVKALVLLSFLTLLTNIPHPIFFFFLLTTLR